MLAGAAASLALTWIIFDPTDVSRVYYGTDTHAAGLLLGVALALVWSPWQPRRTAPVAGAAPPSTPSACSPSATWSSASSTSMTTTWPCSTAATCGSASLRSRPSRSSSTPPRDSARLLGRPPMIWLGLRSYSFYLWHWPVLALTRPGLDVSLPRGILIPLQLLAVLVLADLSYRFVELPFRGRVPLFSLPDGWLRVGRPALAFSVVGDRRTRRLERDRLQRGGREPRRRFDRRIRQGDREGGKPSAGRLARRSHRAFRRGARPPRIVAFGDSVMIGAKDRLAARLGPRFSMNAKVARQASEFVALARRLKRRGGKVDALILQMGNNGPLYGNDMEDLRKATSNVGELFLVTDHAPVSWQDESNHALEEADATWPHTTLIDWAPIAAAHENLLWDGIHLTPAAAGIYTRLIARTVRRTLSADARASAVAPRRARGR